jgi:hypothetical protein
MSTRRDFERSTTPLRVLLIAVLRYAIRYCSTVEASERTQSDRSRSSLAGMALL